MKKTLLLIMALILSSSTFAMSQSEAESCVSDQSNTGLQSTLANFSVVYNQASNVIESSTNALGILVERAQEQVEYDAKSCSDLEDIYSEAASKLTAVIVAVEAITGEPVE